MYALIKDNAVASYPYTDANLRRDCPYISFPGTLTDAIRADFDMYPVRATTSPAYDNLTQNLVEQTPVLSNGEWVQAWAVGRATAQEIAARRAALQAAIADDVQARLDTFARTRGYDGILSACTYAGSPSTRFNTEGQYCVEARDATWAALYTMLDEVRAGTRPVPAGYADIEAELPALAWPA